jgi:lipopolysaccharide export system protein LptA
LDKVNYYTPTIDSLLADTGTYKDNILHLDGHVSLRETIGNLYKTEHAIYDQKKEILTITSPFVAYMDKNIFKGATLIYNAITKEANATMVDAVVYPTEK